MTFEWLSTVVGTGGDDVFRHACAPGHTKTACGAKTVTGAWVYNTRKRRCEECVRVVDAHSDTYSTAQVAGLSGASLRQIEYWGSQGWVEAESVGTGAPRRWTGEQLKTISYIASFVRAGFEVSAAAWLAEQAVAGERKIEFEDGHELRIKVQK